MGGDIDPETIKRWKEGHEAANRVRLEEARSRTPLERWDNHRKYLRHLAEIGRLPERKPEDKFYLRWIEVKERWIERSSGA